MYKILIKLLIIISMQTFLFAQVENSSNIDKKTKNSSIITETKEKKSKLDEELELQQQKLDKIIKNINDKKYLQNSSEKEKNKEEIILLRNKILINKRYKNDLAVKRDELKLIYLKQEDSFQNTLKLIIEAKQDYKDKKYFVKIINENINFIKNNKLESYDEYNSEAKKSPNNISEDLVSNFEKVYDQTNTQLYVLEYLLNNMDKYRQLNFLSFFIDEFNLQYLINKLDNVKGISFISKLTSYYFNFTLGEFLVVCLILLFLRLVNKYVIKMITILIARLFVKNYLEDSDKIRQYLMKALYSPMSFAMVVLGLQISMFILVKDNEFISKINPWLNTTYVALFTWAIYTLLDNFISVYAHNLLQKYPNVRTEMIVFILRIIKIILFLIVILFLFTQLGIDIKAIAASLGVGGIAIALAAKDTLANFFGSLNIMTDNSFSQGDWIKTSNVEGTVVDIRMRTTRIRTFDNALITVPNSKLADSPILNWSKRIIGRRIKMSIGITYDSKMKDIKNLKDDILNMLINHPDIANSKNSILQKNKTFEAIKREDIRGVKNTLLVFIDEYADSSINILVYCFSRSPVWADWLKTKEDVIMKISELVEKNNCEFAFPSQTLYINNNEEDNNNLILDKKI